jgi:hypothetical protein
MVDETKTIELWPCGYDARCNVRNCKAKATTLARSVDAGGRPINQYPLIPELHRNLAIIDEVCSPDFVFHSPKWPNWSRGIESARKLAT